MKKFLFTLVALLMAGSLFAQENYLYVEDWQLTQEEATNGVQNKAIFVVAHFENYVTTVDWTITLPDGMEFVSANMPNAAKPYIWQYVDVEDDDTGEIVSTLTRQRMNPQLFGEYPHYITTTSLGAASDNCYSEDGSVCYGAPKWGVDPVEFNFYRIVVNVAPNFQGGEITVHTEPACTDDPRGNTCPKGTSFDKVAAITVEGGGEPVQTPAPVINVTPGDDAYIFEAVGEGVVTLYLDGNEVENPYTVVRTDVDQIVKFTAVAHVDDQIDGTVTGEYLVPALPVVEPEDLTGDIEISDPDENGVVTITYTGDEDVTITVTVNGEDVTLGEDGTITVEEGESEIVVTVTAEGYNDLTDGKTVTYTVPEPPEQTADPTYTIVDDPDAQTVTITATGDGHITILWDEQVVAEGDGEAVWVIPYGDDPEGEEYGFTVYAQEDGKEMSNPVNGEVVVPGKPAEPQPTATPVITYVVNEEEVIITATGEGEVILMIDGEVVDNPVVIARGEEDVTVVATATAQAEGQLISETAEMEILIPAYVDDPEGHMTGYWVVLIDKDGNEVWKVLENTNTDDPNQFLTNVALHYSQFGGQPLSGDMTDEDNPMVPFYFMVNGVRYSCEGEDVLPVFGNANENPLYESENFWNVPVGYFYTVGVLVNPETGDLYLQISKGIYTGIEELNGDKTVAGVRYYNMAGQEMQEANGMTIVVTTYTDGTTSAVKVMK